MSLMQRKKWSSNLSHSEKIKAICSCRQEKGRNGIEWDKNSNEWSLKVHFARCTVTDWWLAKSHMQESTFSALICHLVVRTGSEMEWSGWNIKVSDV